MENSYSFEVIPAAAIGDTLSGSPALIIDATSGESISNGLTPLHSHGKYKLYYTRPGINQLVKTYNLAQETGLKTIVVCNEDISNTGHFLPKKEYTASLISAGSYPGKQNILETLLKDKNLKEFSHLGYQIYRYAPKILRKLQEHNFEELRLGKLREDITSAEPLLRTKEYIFADLRSVRVCDFPNNPSLSPNGLYAEEFCQLARYIGMAQDLKSLFIFGFPSCSETHCTAGVLTAELIWHTVEALWSNVHEDPSKNENNGNFLRKIVSMGREGQDLCFITSRSSGRWWMEIPVVQTSDLKYIPCSNQDYITACSGDVPLRWLFFFQKLNQN